MVEAQARVVIETPWPDAKDAGASVVANEPPRVHVEPLAERRSGARPALPPVETGPAFDAKGKTLLEAVMLGTALDEVIDALVTNHQADLLSQIDGVSQ